MNSGNLHDLTGHLSKTWDGIPVASSDEELREWLKAKILHLLREDFERLVNAMYRLDIREDKFNHALESGSEIEVVDAITKLVWEREMQRFSTWMKYSKKPPSAE